LRKKYGDKTQENVEIYFNSNNGRFHNFSVLLGNFKERKSDFGVDRDIIVQFFSLIEPFRKSANKKAHSIIHFVESEEDLKAYNIQQLANLLMRLFTNISSNVD
jgi:hypothetical protein